MRALLVSLLVFTATAADACTTFATRGLFGRNYDFGIGDGLLVVNKRGMDKRSATGDGAAAWRARIGSLTFNQFGRDNPTGGINEQGLVVELMWLDGTRYPKADARPQVGTLEWIQYQLDTAANVDEAVANAKRIRIGERGVPLHFLLADRAGNVAAIEFLDGELVVHRGDALPVPVLANDTYASSLQGRSDRFTVAAKQLSTATSIDGAFAILDAVAQGSHTRWSIVYDLRNLTVSWRTGNNREVRSVRLASFDFACATPVRVLDVDAGRGNVESRFAGYTREQNLALVRRSYHGTPFLRDTPDAAIEEVATWPEQSTCATASTPARGSRTSSTHRR